MNFLVSIFILPFRVCALFVGRERVARFFIRQCLKFYENAGIPVEASEGLKKAYFNFTGKVYRDVEFPQ